jgi:hypothetical protein
MRIGKCARCGRELKLHEPRIRVILKNGREVNKTYCMKCYNSLRPEGGVYSNAEK